MNDKKDCLHTENAGDWTHTAPDDMYFNRMNLPESNTLVRQHSHTKAHTTLLIAGKLRAWRDGVLVGEFEAPAGIFIPAYAKHAFLSLAPNTMAFCVFAQRPEEYEPYTDEEVAQCLGQ